MRPFSWPQKKIGLGRSKSQRLWIETPRATDLDGIGNVASGEIRIKIPSGDTCGSGDNLPKF